MALFVSQPGTEEFDRLAIELGHDHDRDGMDDITGEDLYGADSRFEEPDPSEWMPEMPSRRRRYSEEEPYKPERWGSKPDVLRKIWLTFEEPGYSPAALVVNLGVTFLILVAITAFTVETSPEYYGREVAPFPQIEVFCTTVFTLEVVLRAISCPDICAFIKNWWNIADLLAILPYYLEIIAKATGNPGGQGAQYAVVRVVRLVRLLKLVRYGQRNKKMGGMLKVFRETMQESESNLKMMIMFEVLTMVICGAVTYYIERGTFHKDGAACSALLPPGHGFSLVDAEDTCLQGPEGAGLCQYVAGAPAGEECISATAKFCSGVDRLGADCASDQNLLDKTWYFKKNVRKTVGWARNDGTGDCVAPDGSMKCDSGDNDEVACLMRGLTDNDGTACVWAAQNTVAAAMDRVGEEEVTKQAMFPTIFTGMYWTLVTVTGVGYGDMVPTSVAGKFATFITILMGLLLIALPVSVIGGNFQACYMRLIDSEAKQQSSTTASAAAFQMSGLRHRLRAHRDGVEALRRENPIEEPEQAPDQKLPHAHARRGSLDRAKMQLQDMGPKVAESPSKKALNAKKISLNGVRTTRDFARRLAPSDVCASMYMEHLLRALHIADDHFFEAMNECVTEQFIGVLEHTQEHVIGEVDRQAYDAEAAEWSAALWAQTGSGLPEGFHGGQQHSQAEGQQRQQQQQPPPQPEPEPEAEVEAPVAAAAGDDGVQESPRSAAISEEEASLAAMSATELSAEVDSLLIANQNDGPGPGRAPREP